MFAPLEDVTRLPQGPRADLSERWRELCARYLPLTADNSIWRFSRAAAPDAPKQGWKIHVSATVLTACAVLEKIAPLLHGRDTMFKAPSSLLEVHKINCGLYYGYSQVGKLITVYPESPEEARYLSQQLYELTGSRSAPAVPFDLKLRPDGCIYYRYGAFKSAEIESADGMRIPAICDPKGQLVPDLREGPSAKPDWVASLFPERPPEAQGGWSQSPLKTTYKAFRALAQRGRGGVYQALDISVSPPRLCILKEGRREGEMGWDGRDGSWRVRNEECVIASLRAAGVDAPRIYSSFKVEENYYIVTEFIEGETLHAHLVRRKRRLPVARALQLVAELALLLSRIHSAGWVWRDCKPGNIVMTKMGALRPLDFEGACPVESPDPLPWGTAGFTPPQWHTEVKSRVYEDLYALGAVLHLLLTGKLPENPSTLPLKIVRRNIPPQACQLISELLTANPRHQPSVQVTAERLRALLNSHAGGSRGRLSRRASFSNRGSERRSSKAGSTVR